MAEAWEEADRERMLLNKSAADAARRAAIIAEGAYCEATADHIFEATHENGAQLISASTIMFLLDVDAARARAKLGKS